VGFVRLAICRTPSGHRYGGGVVRSFDPGSVTRGTACLTSMGVKGDLKPVMYGQASRVLETTFFGYRDV
jgi:hypothetical protein